MTRLFRLFVSSTFNDLHQERDILQEKVFPLLKRACGRYGYRFQAIDLRWGVTREDCLENRTMQVCLDELAKCKEMTPRPNFLILLGDRYGWRPLPEKIPADEFESLSAKLSEFSPATAGKVKQFYTKEDQNRVDFERVLTSRPSGAEESCLVDALEKAAKALDLPEERLLLYGASATHQEIYHGALTVEDADRHVVAFSRRFSNLDALCRDPDALKTYLDTAVDPETGRKCRDRMAESRMNTLKEALRKRLGSNLTTYDVEWRPGALPIVKDFWKNVFRALWRIILEEIGKRESDPANEKPDHRAFARSAALVSPSGTGFYSRQDIDIDREIEAFLSDSASTSLMVVTGRPGSGKSALLAHTALNSEPEWTVFQFYAGAAGAPATGLGLMAEVVSNLDALLEPGKEAFPGTFEGLAERFHTLLESCRSHRLLIVLDGLDLLPVSDPARSTVWAPSMFRENVRVIISAESAGDLTLPQSDRICFLDLPPIGPGEAEKMLDRWLDMEGRRLKGPQKKWVLKAATDGLPLSLRIAFLRSRKWRSFDPCPRPVSGLTEVIDLWKEELASRHGRLLFNNLSGLLASSREGMTEDELLEMLPTVLVMREFHARFPYSPKAAFLPAAPWAMLMADSEPLLRRTRSAGQNTLTFVHEAVAVHLVPIAARRAWSRRLLGFFLRSKPGPSMNAHGLRALAECPLHLAVVKGNPGLGKLLMTADFLADRVHWHGIGPLLSDFALFDTSETGMAPGGDPALSLLETALKGSASALTTSPRELTGQLHWRLQPAQDTAIGALLADLMARSKGPWLNLQKLSAGQAATVEVLDGHQGAVTHLKPMGKQLLVSGSRDEAAIRVWDMGSLSGCSRTTAFPDGILSDMDTDEDSAVLVTLSKNGTIRAWTADGPMLKACNAIKVTGTTRVKVCGCRLIALTRRGGLTVWDLNAWLRGQTSPALRFGVEEVMPPAKLLAVSETGHIHVGDGDGSIFSVRLEDNNIGKAVRLKQGTADFQATALETCPGSGVLFAGCRDGSIWQIMTGTTQGRSWTCLNEGDGSAVLALACDKDGYRLVAGTGSKVVSLPLHCQASSASPFNPGVGCIRALAVISGHIASAGESRQIALGSGPARPESVTAVAVSPSGRLGTSGDRSGRICIHDLMSGTTLPIQALHDAAVTRIEFSLDEKSVVAASEGAVTETGIQGRLGLVSLQGANPGETCYARPVKGSIRGLCCLPWKERVLALGDGDDEFISCRLPSLEVVESGHVKTIDPLAVSAMAALETIQGGVVVCGSVSGALTVCDPETLTVLSRPQCESSAVDLLMRLKPGEIVAGFRDGTVRVYRIKNRQLIMVRTLAAEPGFGAVSGMAIINGQWLLTSYRDRRLRLWDLVSGKVLASLTLDREVTALQGSREALNIFLLGDRQGRVFSGHADNLLQRVHGNDQTQLFTAVFLGGGS